MHSSPTRTGKVWPRVIGQERVKNLLLSSLRTNRLAHAYLFYGNEGVGKDAMALELARILQCENAGEEACDSCSSCIRMNSLQHPDVRFTTALPVGKGEKIDDAPLAKLGEAEVRIVQEQFSLKGKNPYHRISIPKANIIKISSIRDVRRRSTMSAFSGRRKIFIISRADEMGEEASNTLLKTLEEPGAETILILTTAYRDTLLPTILSRCQNVRFDPLTEEEIRMALIGRENVSMDDASIVARLANGSYTRAMDLLEADVTRQRHDVVAFVRLALGTNVVGLADEIDRLSDRRDKDATDRFLSLMLMWFRDVLVMVQGGSVINLDQSDDLKRFIAKFPRANLIGVVTDIDRAISLVHKNVYIKLVLLQLCVRLKENVLGEAKELRVVL